MSEFLGMGFAIAAAYCLSLLPVALLALAVPYAVLRLKAEAPGDPQLGAKVVFQFFFSAGLLVCLAGVTFIAVDWMTRESPSGGLTENAFRRATFSSLAAEGFSIAQRTGLGMILSGAIAAAAHALLMQATSVTHRQRVRRIFVGWRLAIHGVIVMIALTALLVLFLQQDAFEMPLVYALRAVTATLFVWATSWVVHLGLMFEMAQRIRRETTATTDGNGATLPLIIVPQAIAVDIEPALPATRSEPEVPLPAATNGEADNRE